MTQTAYRYDGTFAGFLTCVFDSYVNREEPAAFLLPEDGATLWEERETATHPAHARRVYKALGEKVSPRFRQVVERGFLTCLPQRELALYQLIHRGLKEGDAVLRDLADPIVNKVMLALRKLATEEDHLKGFVRFSDLDGTLVGEIQPKNRVLPLLAPHFASRFPGEKLVLYDRTHHEAFIYVNQNWTILPAEDFHMDGAGEAEESYRALWRRYFSAVAIEGRYNAKCQDTHLPKRYRHVMTEFQTQGGCKPPLEGHTEGYAPLTGRKIGLTEGEQAYV